MKEYFKLIRVKHYLKNLLIFFPLFFSHNLFNLNLLLKLILSFLSFCFACSIVYIVNDIKDRDKDKLHEKKKNRPIASGKISIKNALFVIFILVILSGLCFFFSEANIFAGIYIIILAMLFGYETKQLNRQVLRNINRFPENYCFQITDAEYISLRCQNGTLKNGRG